MRYRWATLFLALNILIFVSTALAYTGLKLVKWHKETRFSDPQFQIGTLIQTGPEKEALPTIFLEEVLDLSRDQPISTYAFSPRQAEQKLLKTDLIRTARVRKEGKTAVLVDYEKRDPIALLADFENRAIDQELALFPFSPFYPPQKLPKIYLGIEKYEGSLQNIAQLNLAVKVLNRLWSVCYDRSWFPYLIDVSQSNHQSLGKREIVAVLERGEMKHYLRLTPKRYQEEIGNYLTISDKITREGREDYDRVIDFRVSDLAFVEECERRKDG